MLYMYLDSYYLNHREALFSALTLSGGVLAKRHWEMSNFPLSTSSRWGHKVIATIEAVPILGGLAALIEIVIARYFKPKLIQLNFNEPTFLTSCQVIHRQEDSIYEIVKILNGGFVAIRRKKGEPPLAGKSVTFPPFQGPTRENEGMKTRSFSLELMSNIEDLMGNAFNKRLDECRGVVRYFLEKGALKLQAGFEDYLNLLNILEKECQEVAPLLKRHRELVDLQKKLIVKTKTRRWRNVSFLFPKHLAQTAEQAQAIGLHPFPALPERQTIVNLYPTFDAINLLIATHREAGRWLMTRTTVLTFKELCKSIKTSCAKLRDTILQWEDYYLVTIEGKSQEWMADIGYRYLPPEKMPKGVIKENDHRQASNLATCIKQSRSRNFIMFDDAAYSGRQIEGYLSSLHLELLSDPSYHLSEEINLYFIFGFYPKDKNWRCDWRRFLSRYDSFHCEALNNINVHFITSHYTKTCKMLMEEEKLSPPLKEKIGKLANENNPLLVTEWKTPDFASISRFITQGILDQYSRTSRKEHSQLDAEFALNPITPVQPPYSVTVER